MKFVTKSLSLSCVATGVVLAVSAVATADEEHYDIGVWNDSGVLRTGGWDHDTEQMAVDYLRVFEAEFGEDASFPFSTDEPGIGGVAADIGLAEGDIFQLNIASGLGRWNGNGFDFGGDTNIDIEYLGANVDTLSGGSIDFLVADDYDYHPFYTIGSTGIPSDGAYLMELNASMAGLQSSESFWVVFNLGLDEEDYEASVEWVEENLVPAPAALPLLGLMGCGAVRRRRK